MSYDYNPNIQYESQMMPIFIKWLEDRKHKVVDCRGGIEDFAHLGDIIIDKKYAQIKTRREKYYNTHLKDDLIFITIADPRVEATGRQGTSIFRDRSDLFITAYFKDGEVAKVIILKTQAFKDWLQTNKTRYKKVSSRNGSQSVGALVKVSDIPPEMCQIR